MKRGVLLALMILPFLSLLTSPAARAGSEEIIFYDGLQVPAEHFSGHHMWFVEWWYWYDGFYYEKTAGYIPGTDAISWYQSSGRSELVWDFADTLDFSGHWKSDTLKIKIKAPTYNDTLIVEFASGEGKTRYYLSAANFTFDPDTWKMAAIPLQNFMQVPETLFDTTAVTQFSIYTLHGISGNILLLTDIWIGQPRLRQPVVFFTGQVIPDVLFSSAGWWSASEWLNLPQLIVTNPRPAAGTRSITWPQRAGLNGIVWRFKEPHDFRALLTNDSLHLMILAPLRTSGITIEINSGAGEAIQYYLDKPEAPFDSSWHQLDIPLRDFALPSGKSPLDSQYVAEIGFFTENGTDGLALYLSHIWIGTPSLTEPDTDPPAAPTDLSTEFIRTNPYYFTRVRWSDVPDETGETYDLYASTQPFSDIQSSGVQKLASALGERAGETGHIHYTFAPILDASQTWYFAVTCTDQAGNVSAPGFFPPTELEAMGISIISMTAPLFVADGLLNEWTHIRPFYMGVSTVWSTGVNDNSDLSAEVYVAVDADHLYFAAQVTDDKFMVDASSGSWYGQWDRQDAITLYIGLYDLPGVKHTNSTTSTMRATEPDYAITFMRDKLWVRTLDSDWDYQALFESATDSYWFDRAAGESWTVEAKIPLDLLVREKNGITDRRFHAAKGMRLPLDITIYDKDFADQSVGSLVLSPYNLGGWNASWYSPSFWMYTWLGTWATGVEGDSKADFHYELMQNYPNPFNPSTQIIYYLERPSQVSLKIFNLLGDEVTTLVQGYQTAGRHCIDFDILKGKKALPSGVYLYRLQTEGYCEQKKMVLVK